MLQPFNKQHKALNRPCLDNLTIQTAFATRLRNLAQKLSAWHRYTLSLVHVCTCNGEREKERETEGGRESILNGSKACVCHTYCDNTYVTHSPRDHTCTSRCSVEHDSFQETLRGSHSSLNNQRTHTMEKDRTWNVTRYIILLARWLHAYMYLRFF